MGMNFEEEQIRKRTVAQVETLNLKKEYTQLKFDPNVRHRMEEMPNHLMYRAYDGFVPQLEPQSCYVSVNHNGKIYHLFNGARLPMGRIAEMISTVIRGKNKPGYDAMKGPVDGDICIVVNAKNMMVTGKKLRQKMYRYHTGYAGGLKEMELRHLLEKDARKAIYYAVKGMLPRNKHREGILKRNIIVHDGPYHTQTNWKLPQFGQAMPHDINAHFGLDKVTDPEEFKIIYASDPNNIPEELKDHDVELDHSLTIPAHLREKQFTDPKVNRHLARHLRRSYKGFKKYRKYN